MTVASIIASTPSAATPALTVEICSKSTSSSCLPRSVELAEKEGKHVALMVVPSANVFDAILQTGSRWSRRVSSAACPTG